MEDKKCANCGKSKTIYNEREFSSFDPEADRQSFDLCSDCIVEITGKKYDLNTTESIISLNKIGEWAKQKELKNQDNS